MKVSLNWIKEYADVKLSVDQIVEKIGAQLGATEEVKQIGLAYQHIVIVRVVECQKHPNADKLHVCKIDDSKVAKGVKREENGYVRVVCGAPNVRAGMLAAWLPPGAIVPSTYDKEQFKLEAREIRGVISNGMLASAHELGIGDDHSGIVEVEDAKPGDDFAKTYKLDDTIIDIENKMFTHRPDCFGVLGVAREIAGITHKPFESPSWYKLPVKLSKESPTLPLKVKNELPGLVPRFTAVAIRLGHNGPSPLWMQSYLSRVGLRPINTAVDITNYFMYLTGQPLHAYDADKLQAVSNQQKAISLETRLSRKGEKLKLLNGKEITFDNDATILITSHGTPVGIGGVMGGAETEVDENTRSVVVECANFDMYAIRRTAMKYGLFTDAVTRFNKGQSSLQQDRVIARVAQDLAKLSQGSIASGIIDKHASLEQPKPVRVAPEFINERLGLKLTPKKMTELLENVEFKVLKAAGKQLAVSPPFWRTDIQIPEDVVEEVGRLHGYDRLPLELPRRDLAPAQKDPVLEFKSKIRDILSKAGANEALTYSFVHGDLMKKAGQDSKHAFQLNNALSPDLQYFRLSLTPSLLSLIHPNIKAGHDEFALFEIGKGHNKEHLEKDGLPKEVEKLALVVAADQKAAQKIGGAPYYQAYVYLRQLAKVLNLRFAYQPFDKQPDYQTAKPYYSQRSAVVVETATGLEVGIIGEFSHSVAQALKLPAFAAGFELSTAKLLNLYSGGTRYQTIPHFPKVEQDMTLKLSSRVSYSQIFSQLSEKLRELKPDNTTANLTPLDIYQKAADTKHFTWRLSIASYERTMTDHEVNKLLEALAAVAREQFKAERI